MPAGYPSAPEQDSKVPIDLAPEDQEEGLRIKPTLQEMEEADRKESARLAKEEADKKAMEEADRKAAKEEADRKEGERLAKEKADRKAAQEEADRKAAKEEGDRKAAKQEADRKAAKQEADRKAAKTNPVARCTNPLTAELSLANNSCVMEATELLAVLSVVAPPANGTERAALRLSVVIDTSGSMNGEKLRLVGQTMLYMLRHLSSRDALGLIEYGTTVRVAAPMMFVMQLAVAVWRRP